MPRINWYDPEEYDDIPTRETIRRNTEPVNGHHDMQRRTENAVNRNIKVQRAYKQRSQYIRDTE